MRNFGIRTQEVGAAVLLLLWGALTPVAGRAASIGPDKFGYVATDATPYSFVDIASTGAAVLSGADDDTALVNLGFPFVFYGKAYTSICVSTNGLLTFGGCNADFASQDLTATKPAGDNPTVAPMWTDLTFGVPGGGAVYYQTLGSPGSRQFVVQWQAAYAPNGVKGLTFQAVLSEGGGKILFQYLDVDAGAGSATTFGGNATVGIREAGGQATGRVLQWSYKVPVLRNGQAIQFVPDAVPPVITGMPGAGCVLWPPNDKLVEVAKVSASDAGTGVASFTVTGVSNEPAGKEPDIVITAVGGTYVVQLRAKRLGTGTDRVYTLTATAKDGVGNVATATSQCTVPHDVSKK